MATLVIVVSHFTCIFTFNSLHSLAFISSRVGDKGYAHLRKGVHLYKGKVDDLMKAAA